MSNNETVIIALISLGIVVIGLSWRVFSEGKLFQNRNQVLTFFFSHIYFSLINVQGQYFTLLEGLNVCNSWMTGLGSAISEEFLNFCRTINMFFYLSIISLILGIIFIVIGLIKRK